MTADNNSKRGYVPLKCISPFIILSVAVYNICYISVDVYYEGSLTVCIFTGQSDLPSLLIAVEMYYCVFAVGIRLLHCCFQFNESGELVGK